MHFTILGKRWRLEWVKRFPHRQQCGECDHPNAIDKAIKIKEGMSEQDTLDTLIHESIHAAGWHLDEDFVEELATDIARMLIRLGYRRS